MYFQALIISLIFSWLLTWVMLKLALKLNIVDFPQGDRKIHKKPIPLLGGVAVFGSFFITLFLNLSKILSPTVQWQFIVAMFLGAFIIMFGGYLDDKYNLPPAKSIIAPLVAVLILTFGGFRIDYITNPLGGQLFFIPLFGFLAAFFWVLVITYTTKLLDGLDGLVAGITTIGAVIIFFASWQKYYVQPEVALLAIILAGAGIGFWVWNFNPAKIFLGEGGSLLCGFLLASLAILAKGKLATTLLVLGIPILDSIWVVWRRWQSGQSIKIADRKHLHHRLLDSGLTQRQAVLVYYFLTAVFGGTALFLQSRGKVIALVIVILIMIIIAGYLAKKNIKN